jgi:hypothetical protein
MESTKTSRSVVVAVLVLLVSGLTALNIYQDHVIAKQRFELHWLLTHSTIRPDILAAEAAKKAPAASTPNRGNAPAASVAEVSPSSKPAAPARPVAKP